MGYIRHHAIVVTSGSYRDIEAVYEKAREIFPEDQVTGVLETMTNGYFTFLIGPDGSKEFWPQSDSGDTHRAQFIEWLKADDWCDWAEIQYGDEEGRDGLIQSRNVQSLA